MQGRVRGLSAFRAAHRRRMRRWASRAAVQIVLGALDPARGTLVCAFYTGPRARRPAGISCGLSLRR